jgi:3-methyl-2-oxobutanoate hydroxymethyltransferase
MSERRLSVPAIRSSKRSNGDEPLVMVTAYDEPSARFVDAAGVDMILVGDSVGNTVLGFNDTLHVTIEMMVHHTAAVARAQPDALIIGDLPWMSYHVSSTQAVESAAMLIRAGAQAVKLEGGSNRAEAVRAIVDAEIPVMGHIGLTPQSVNAMGGYRVQGKSIEAAEEVRAGAQALEEAGCFGLVLEGVPEALGAAVTAERSIPTIGIGAGPRTDGQVLVFHDILGLGNRTPAKFVRVYADIGSQITTALQEFCGDVRAGTFPGEDESYATSEKLSEHLEHE